MENLGSAVQRSGSSLRVSSARIDGSDVHRTGSWLTRATSARSLAFSHSSWEEDDEEQLKWAALEKLPTFNRVRKGILMGSEGERLEVDVEAMGTLERKMLLDRLMRVADDDNEKVGIELPTIEVRYNNLEIHAEAYVGGRALPTIANFFVNKIGEFLSCLHILPNRKQPMTILRDVSGIIKPCRLTLLLGPPGSGKTTLLLALAGKLPTDLKVSGEITYNGHRMDEFVPERTAAYISQHDTHIGELTVRETLNFSARCQGVGTRYDMLTELARREKEASVKPDPDIDIFMKAITLEGQENVVTDYFLKILGLDICADTLVGDEMLRGISGGQKKRVTTGEMIVGPSRALFMDEISTGLDSSTTFQIVKSIRLMNHILGGTAVIALLQPAPETYELFDDIILLSEGQIVYQGQREHVLEFFESMGFKCPERKAVADFLQEVTSRKDQQQYWAHPEETYKFVPVSAFVNAFHSFHVGQRLKKELSTPFDKNNNHPAALTKSKYGIGKKELLKACFEREFLLMKRNSFVYIFKLFQLSLICIISSTVFLRTEMHHQSVEDGFIYMGALFIGLVTHTFNGFAELAMSVVKLPVFYKQRDFLFFPAWAYAIPTWLLKVPVTFVECTLYVALTYCTIGFDPNIQREYQEMVDLGLLDNSIDVAAAFTTAAKIPLYIQTRTHAHKEKLGKAHMSLTIRNSQLIVEESDEKPTNNIKDDASTHEEWGRIEITTARSNDITKENKKMNGMSLPFPPLSIVFENIKYSVDMPKELRAEGIQEDRLMLLKGASGAFRPGVLTALMGVSGAGKTTLMDVLAGRKTSGYIEGSISISGYPKKQETFARITGYCEQNDIHSPNVTVHESLTYSAWLRLPKEIDSKSREMFIEEVMELVELTPLRNALVGLPRVNGLSVEQRKRLTIAVELVANPSIIFMDEPTSGLDARAAAIVMRTVRNTVNTGRTVVCTIHQPSIDIFDAFDESIPGIVKIKHGYNPATWMLEMSTLAQEEALRINFSDIYHNSELYRKNKELVTELSTPPPGSDDLYFPTKYSQNFLTQCLACLWKQHNSYWRNPAYNAVRIIFTIVLALIVGTVFWKLGSKRKSQKELFNAMGSMYVAVMFTGIQNSQTVQPIIDIERAVFYREKAAGMYSALPYAWAQVVIEIPYTFVQAVVYCLLVYSMIEFQLTAVKFFWYIFFTFFTLLYFTYYGMMAVAMTPNAHIASVTAAAFYSIWNLFASFVIPRTRLPKWWRWYFWACPVSWTLYGLLVSQFGDIDDTMDNGVSIKDYIRNYFGYRHSFLPAVAVVVIGYALLFASAFAYAIKTLNFQKR
ncbi:hypothetical protein LUZ61_004968 [Rhynchospora tenuis]|uniref:ABC transporter domain-containing protein n=1 Tax=Rhynchospora tenuis TaxID=198213 RepID=A0AAD6EU62_9POAL|nr:hypothetical protein LUZ61_004968 [Rhynchospora tenuis]